jgi:hypothetical protein
MMSVLFPAAQVSKLEPGRLPAADHAMELSVPVLDAGHTTLSCRLSAKRSVANRYTRGESLDLWRDECTQPPDMAIRTS